jgi:hypothetical protein
MDSVAGYLLALSLYLLMIMEDCLTLKFSHLFSFRILTPFSHSYSPLMPEGEATFVITGGGIDDVV